MDHLRFFAIGVVRWLTDRGLLDKGALDMDETASDMDEGALEVNESTLSVDDSPVDSRTMSRNAAVICRKG